MTKGNTTMALATLAVTQLASAQSSVTLFGVVDASISHYEVKSAFYNNTAVPSAIPLAAPTAIKRSLTALHNSGYNTSRIGFRGTEDLGGGLAAGFWLESLILNDSGSKGVSDFARRSTVSLSGGFGEFRLGRDYTPTVWNDSVFDPFGSVGVGVSTIFTVNSNLAIARGAATVANPGVIGLGGTDSYVRTSNSIGYFLPSSLGGFYGQVQYAFHENAKVDGLAGSPSTKGRYVGGRFGYANGPVDVAASYGESTVADVTATTAAGVATGLTADEKLKSANVGASYDLGPVKLFGELSRVTDDLSTTTPIIGGLAQIGVRDKVRYTGGLIGATLPIGPGFIRAAYSRVKFKNGMGLVVPAPLTHDAETSANKIAVGYVHNLSKRTALYATASHVRVKNGQNNPAIMGVVTGGASPAFLSTGGGTVGYAPRSATGYDFGIRHAF
jgi:predicted porin